MRGPLCPTRRVLTPEIAVTYVTAADAGGQVPRLWRSRRKRQSPTEQGDNGALAACQNERGLLRSAQVELSADSLGIVRHAAFLHLQTADAALLQQAAELLDVEGKEFFDLEGGQGSIADRRIGC